VEEGSCRRMVVVVICMLVWEKVSSMVVAERCRRMVVVEICMLV
jgi:hypothetical protein